MRLGQRARLVLAGGLAAAAVLGTGLTGPGTARADLYYGYATGSASGTEVIFRVVFDPAVAGSAVATPVVSDTLRLDGIDYVPGDPSRVVVGAQTKPAGGGAITQYDVVAGTKEADFITSTNAVTPTPPTSGVSRPSSVLSTPSHAYYVENQFGFTGGTNRIMLMPFGGPPGTAEVAFDGSMTGALGLKNFEGLEIVGDRLYFFAEDHTAPDFRALYSIGLDGTGLWDDSAPMMALGMLTEAAGSTDGSDELDLDPTTGLLYGSNIVSGEVIVWDTTTSMGGFLISPGDIAAAPAGSNLARLKTGLFDGIRTTDDGFLILTGLDGVIMSIDLPGIAFDGLDDGDLKILYDDDIVGAGYTFDDITPLTLVPEPGSLVLLALGGLVLLKTAGRHRRENI